MGSEPFLIHTSTNNVIPFNGATCFTIGRSGDSNLDIAAIYISRKQCSIRHLPNIGWALFDESRFKTTRLNNESLDSCYKILKDGDKISFSVVACSNEYIFHCNDQEVLRKKRRIDNLLTQVNPDFRPLDQVSSENDERLSPLDLLKEMATQSSFSLLSPRKDRTQEIEKLKKENILLDLELKKSREQLSSSNLTVTVLETENQTLLSRIEELENMKKSLETKAESSKTSTNDNHNQIGTNEDKLLELKNKLDEINKENAELKEMIEDAESEIDHLLKERCCKLINGIFSVKKENTVDTLAEVEFSLMKEDLKELSVKNTELSTNLEKLTVEKEKFSCQLNENIDSELYCSICSDLIYQATTLQCKHTFCKVCIEEWKKKKKECPVCRAKIKTQVPCLVIDNFIDKLVDMIGGEMKSRRHELAAERSAIVVAPTPRNNKRKRNVMQSFATIPTLDPIFDHIGVPMLFERGAPPLIFPSQVIDLTNGSPPHPPFRGFERHARRRRR